MKNRFVAHCLCYLFMATILLGVHKGKVALWKDNDPEPFKVFPYRVSLLPDEAQQALRKGIRVESMDELNRMLEAYLS